MSETNETAPRGGDDEPQPSSEPAATPAPVNEGAATEEREEETKQSRGDRRFAVLSAQLSAARAENERLRRGDAAPQAQQQPEIPPEWRPWVDQQIDARAAAREAERDVNAFHAAGRAEHGQAKWDEIRFGLIDMGSDPELSRLLVEAPNGHRIAAALADDPEELQRIASLRGERARAIALGKYAAQLEERPAPPRRVAAVSRAPAPIRPVTGSVSAEPNAYLMSADQAADYYMAMDLKSRSRT